jgi:hypothetical protein
MGRPKELLRPCRYEVAVRLRHCAQNDEHLISAGERCLVFKENMQQKSYCLACARAILERGRHRVEELVGQLSVQD